jgi:hypothetical protein
MKKLGYGLVAFVLYGIVAVMSACNPGGSAPAGGDPLKKLGVINPVQQFYPAPNRNQFASENSYLTITNPTIGTGETWVAAQTAFVDTGPNFWIHNNENTSTGRTLFLDYLKMISTAVGTAAVSWQYAVILDPIPRTITTNHFETEVIRNANSGAGPVSLPTIRVQTSATASVLSASSASSWTAARGMIGGLNIAGHEYAIVFGDYSGMSPFVGSTDTAGAPGRSVSSSPPVAIAPGHDCSIYIWGPSSSASLAPEFELGMVAR